MERQQAIGSRSQKYSKVNNPSSKPIDEKNSKDSKTKKRDRRILIAIIIFVCFIIFIIGAVIGYGLVGDGNASDIFKIETWTHLYKLVFG